MTKKQKTNRLRKKKKVTPGRSRTRDSRRVRATRYPLRHATIAKTMG